MSPRRSLYSFERETKEGDFFMTDGPDPNCPICHGRTIIEPNNVPCSWVIRWEFNKFLGPIYRDAEISKKIQKPGDLLRNLYFVEVDPVSFRSLVKTVLLDAYCKNLKKGFSHKTLSGYEVFQTYLGQVEGMTLMDLYKSDLFILKLAADPHNNFYGEVFQNLIESRMERGTATWVNSRYKIDSEVFRNAYSFDFSCFLQESFKPLKVNK
jgi:hypothetical protein